MKRAVIKHTCLLKYTEGLNNNVIETSLTIDTLFIQVYNEEYKLLHLRRQIDRRIKNIYICVSDSVYLFLWLELPATMEKAEYYFREFQIISKDVFFGHLLLAAASTKCELSMFAHWYNSNMLANLAQLKNFFDAVNETFIKEEMTL